MIQVTPQEFSSTSYPTPAQRIDKQVQSEEYDAGSQFKTGMPIIIRSTISRIDNVEEVTLEDVSVLFNSTAEERQSQSSNQQDSFTPTESARHNPQQYASYFDQAINFIRKIERQQIVVIMLLAICIVFSPSASTTFNIGDYTIYETVYPKLLFQKASKAQILGQQQANLMTILYCLADQDRVIIYLPKYTQKLKIKDNNQLSYTKCIESIHQECIDYRLLQYGSINLQLQNWVFDHISGHQRIAFESNANFSVVILLAAMKIKYLSLSSEIKKILIIESYMDQTHTNAIKLSLIENQCQDFVEFLSERSSFHKVMKSFDYIFVSSVFYMQNIYPFQHSTGLLSSLTFVIYVSHNTDSFLVTLKQQANGRQLYMIKFHIDEGKYYVVQQINITSKSQSNSKEVMIILIKHVPSTPNTNQITAT